MVAYNYLALLELTLAGRKNKAVHVYALRSSNSLKTETRIVDMAIRLYTDRVVLLQPECRL